MPWASASRVAADSIAAQNGELSALGTKATVRVSSSAGDLDADRKEKAATTRVAVMTAAITHLR